jgi:multiple sugar transport system substrate-binding protein
MQLCAVVLAAALVLAPLGARGADLVVWWEQGVYPEEDEAVREIVAAFEQGSGKRVELVLGRQEELLGKTLAAIETGRRPPDFIFTVISIQHYEQWAYEGRLVDLTDAIGAMAAQFDQAALERVTLLDGTTGRRGLYMLPMGLASHHVHAWMSLLASASNSRAGQRPKSTPAFWTATN